MNWEIIVCALAGLMLVPEVSRQLRGTRCPACQSRLRRTGLTQIIQQGEFTTWLCPRCGSRFYGEPPHMHETATESDRSSIIGS